MAGRRGRSDWGTPVTGLPVRLALLLFSLPLIGLSVFGILFNWPHDCSLGGCGAEFTDSPFWSGYYGLSLAVCITGAVVFALGRVKPGLALLALSTVATFAGITL
jgi:hypothetical protein